MKLLLYISDAIIPILLFIILFHALLGKGRVYEDFLEGAKDGFHTVIGIMPTLLGLMGAVGVLGDSGVRPDCRESMFYSLAVYFMSVGIRKTRWTLAGALVATLAGLIASVILGRML